MATVNLNTDYRQPLAEAFEFTGVFAGKTAEEYSWRGSEAIVLTEIETDALNDYNRTASANRYGTPSEVGDRRQILALQKDRSFSKAVDRGNFEEQDYLKTGAKVVKAYMDERVAPEMEQFILKEMALNAGTSIAMQSAPAAATILADALAVETAMDDARVPKEGRFLAMKHEYVAYLRSSLTGCDGITDRMLLKGIVGRLGTLNILGVSSGDLPSGVYMIGWQKQSVAAPKTIEDVKVTKDAPGISGLLVEGRFRYGAFVVGKRAEGVVLVCADTSVCAKPTVTKGESATTITTTTAGATIRYTLDGSDPRYSATAIAYTAAVTNPDAGTVIRAYAAKDGMFASGVKTHTCA